MRRFSIVSGSRWQIFPAALLLASSGAVSAEAAPHTYAVPIAQMRYGNLPDHLNVGDTIVWVNKDTVPHTVTARDHSFDIRIGPGKRMSQKLDKAGSFPFYCIYHAAMRGTLNVAP